MGLVDLLSLELNKDSINSIESFVASAKSSNRVEYLKGMLLLAKNYKAIDEDNKSIILIEELFNEGIIKKYPSISIEALDILIDIYMSNEDFEECNKYIIKKKELVGSNTYLYLYDLVNLYEKTNKTNEQKKLIVEMLNLDIPDDIRVDILERMIDILINEQAYDYAKSYSITLFNQLDLIENNNALLKNKYKYCLILYYLNDYSYINELEELDFNDSEMNAYKQILLIKTYQKLKEFKKCNLLESTLDTAISKYNDAIKKEFYLAAIDLYKEIGVQQAIDYYEGKLNNLKLIKLETKKAKKELKTILANKPKQRVDSTKEELYRVLDNINKLLLEFSDVKIDDLPRNILMYMGRIIAKKIKIKDMILIFNDKMYHYKKDRVYDKELKLTLDTLFDPLFQNGCEMLYFNKSDLAIYNDIITNESFIKMDVDNAYTKPLFVDSKMLGGLVIYGDSKLLSGFNYEMLNVFTNILLFKLTHNLEYSKKVNLDSNYEEAYNNSNALIKYKINDELYLSNKLAELLGTKNYIFENQFLSRINSSYINNYKERFYLDEEVKIKIKDRYYLEQIKKINDFTYSSVLVDVTNDELNEMKNKNKSFNDQITGLKNKHQLEAEFVIDKKKMSFVLIDIAGFKEINQIYGIIKGNQILQRLGKLFSDAFGYESCYKLFSDEFLIILDYNDTRAVRNNLTRVFDKITHEMKKLDVRLDIYLQAGVVRYPTQKNDDRLDKLLMFSSFAKRLAASKRLPYRHQISMFDQNEYKKFLDEDITSAHIIEAIDNDLLRINYTPIVNKRTKRLYQYEVSFLITNYDIPHEEILRVAKLRNILSSVEGYLVRKSLEQLQAVIKEYNKYYNILISVSKIDNEFIELLKKQIKKNNYLTKALTIKVNDSCFIKELREMGIHVASSNINDLYLGIDYFISSLTDRMNNDSIRSLEALCKSLNTVLILENAYDTDLDIELTKLKKQLTYQDVLKRVKR